jgi:dTDP-4-dehydrorhamnose reductase
MIFCSTDFVFSGSSTGFYSEDDQPEPLNIYGKSKLAGEGELMNKGTGLIARLSLMFDPPTGVENKSWAKLRKQLECNAEVTGVVDEWRTPLSYNSAALILLKLARVKRTGIIHIGGAERLSPFELIAQMKAKIGSRSEILPIQIRQLEQKYIRPRDVSLSTHRLTKWLEMHEPSEIQQLPKRSIDG